MYISATLGNLDTDTVRIDARSAGLIVAKPDHMFHALNRIEALTEDLLNIERANATNPSLVDVLWSFRNQIDNFRLPSMMVGDGFTIRDDNGYLVATFTCKDTGWAQRVNWVKINEARASEVEAECGVY